MCEWGRESVESWGRRRRSAPVNDSEEASGDDMTLSQEILVLDFGDDKQSQSLRSEASTDFGKGTVASLGVTQSTAVATAVPLRAHSGLAVADHTVIMTETCPTRTSVLALGVTCALLALVYLSTLLCYCTKKWMYPQKVVA